MFRINPTTCQPNIHFIISMSTNFTICDAYLISRQRVNHISKNKICINLSKITHYYHKSHVLISIRYKICNSNFQYMFNKTVLVNDLAGRNLSSTKNILRKSLGRYPNGSNLFYLKLITISRMEKNEYISKIDVIKNLVYRR